MLERLARGELPAKLHTQLVQDKCLRYEHCVTRDGFDGPFTIQYHQHRPQAARVRPSEQKWLQATAAATDAPLARLHFAADRLPRLSGGPLEARLPLLFNQDVTVSRLRPNRSSEAYFCNADGDTLLFIQQGAAEVVSAFGKLTCSKHDYVYVPKGVAHRFVLGQTEQDWLEIELKGRCRLPRSYTNEVGQLRMDAPYSHRDFIRPEFCGPIEEGIRRVVCKRSNQLQCLDYDHSPLDVVGFDGCVYPFAFPIADFQPKVSSVHLPPTIHGTFAARGVLVCSFVPRPVDFHPQAIPCPYPHSSVDIDEVLFYCDGDFTSRSGVSAGSITLHARGIAHGPQPGRYEASIGKKSSSELAVMLDCAEPLQVADAARPLIDESYAESFV